VSGCFPCSAAGCLVQTCAGGSAGVRSAGRGRESGVVWSRCRPCGGRPGTAASSLGGAGWLAEAGDRVQGRVEEVAPAFAGGPAPVLPCAPADVVASVEEIAEPDVAEPGDSDQCCGFHFDDQAALGAAACDAGRCFPEACVGGPGEAG